MSILRKAANGTAAFVVAVSSLLTLAAPAVVHAAGQTCTWTGSGSDSKFSTAANWSNCNSDVPQTGDTIAFNVSSLSNDTTLTNDISGLSVGGITFSGTNANWKNYIISGQLLTVTGDITNTATDGGSPADPVQSVISTPLVLGADVTVSEVAINGAVTTGGHTLTLSTAFTCGLSMSGAISGAGAVVVSTPSTAGVNISGDNSSFTGSFTANSGSRVGFSSVASVGQASGLTATNATVSIGLQQANRTLSTPLNLSGTLDVNRYNGGVAGCVGGSGGAVDPTAYTLTLSGGLTLNGNLGYYGHFANTTVQNPYTAAGYTSSVKDGSTGTLTLPSGLLDIPVATNEYNDNTPSQYVNVGNRQTAIVKGTVGDVYVAYGGVLKGNGTVSGDITIDGGGVVAPGLSPGCLTSNTLSISGSYQFELGGTDACTGYDQIKVLNPSSNDNAVQINDAAIVTSRYNGYTPKKGQVFTIIDQAGDKAVSGTFKDLPEGATFEQNGVVFKISYVGGTGNDVTLTVQNVPATPDTGFVLVTAHPLVSLFILVGISGMLVALARRSSKLHGKA